MFKVGRGCTRFLCSLYSLLNLCYLCFSTPDNRPTGLEEVDQQSLPGEQGINLDTTGPKLPDFSNRPPGNKILAKIINFALHIHLYKASFLPSNNNALCLLTRLLQEYTVQALHWLSKYLNIMSIGTCKCTHMQTCLNCLLH